MRKIVLHSLTSLDGHIEDSQKHIDWNNVDEPFERYVLDLLISVGGMIFGRRTHELLGDYWPNIPGTLIGSSLHHMIAAMMNCLPKYVLTQSNYQSDWENTVILGLDARTQLSVLKEEDGQDLVLFGGGAAQSSLMKWGLIDEFRLLVNPVLLGADTRLFARQPDSQALQLSSVQHFDSGNALLTYQSAVSSHIASSTGNYNE